MKFCGWALLPWILFQTFAADSGLLFQGSAGIESPGEVKAIAVANQSAVVAAGQGGVQFYDLSTPLRPRLVSQVQTSIWGKISAEDVRTAGNLAFVATLGNGLDIYDVSNVSNVVRLGGFRARGTPGALELSGNTVFLACGTEGLYLLDISRPASPAQTGRYPRWLDESLDAHDVRVSGSYAFVAGGADGLVVLQISNPDSISVAARLALGSSARALDLQGTRAFVVREDGRIQPVDISNPAKPLLAGAPSEPLFSSVVADSSLLYAAGKDGLKIFDLAASSPFQIVAQFNTPGSGLGIHLSGKRILVADGPAGFEILERSAASGAAPVISVQPANSVVGAGGTLHLQVTAQGASRYQWLRNNAPIDGAVSVNFEKSGANTSDEGAYSVVVSSDAGSSISEPAQVTVVLPPQITRQPEDDRLIEGRTLYLSVSATPSEGLGYQWFRNDQLITGATNWTLELTNASLADSGDYSVSVQNLAGSMRSDAARVEVRPRAALENVALWPEKPLADPVEGVVVSGNRAFVSCGYSGVYILDISDPSAPAQMGHVPSLGYSASAYIRENTLFIADGINGGLQIVNVADPANPVRVGQLTTGSQVNAVDVSGNLACLAAGDQGLVTADVTDPAKPKLLGSYAELVDARGISISGNYAHVADWIGGYAIIDISNPAQPKITGKMEGAFPGLYSVRGVQVRDGLAFLATAYDGIDIVDVSDPTKPSRLSGYDTSGFGLGVALRDDYAVLCDGDGGIKVFDVSFPAFPLLAGSFDTAGSANAAAFAGDYILVADGDSGLVVVRSGLTPASPQAPVLSSRTLSNPLIIEISVTASNPMAEAVVEQSPDLRNWLPVWTNTAAGTSVKFTAPIGAAGTAPKAFFRARVK